MDADADAAEALAAEALAAEALAAEALAAQVLAVLDGAAQIAPFTDRDPGFDLPAAYRVTAALRRLRVARGEKPVGRKIGFTNRRIWSEYGVHAPIWGDMFDTTVRDVGPEGEEVDLSSLSEPKVEPEIAVGLSRAPEPGMDDAALMGCIDWVAHGLEIVQSVYPGWRLRKPDTVAGAGMHGLYLLGPRHPVRPAEAGRWRAELGDFAVTLLRGGETIDRGHSSDVLDGPVSALGSLADLLADDPDNPPLAAGEIVTTGTVTRALSVAPGETWGTRIEGLGLPGLRVRFR
jgi:2-oxo-3-hexenedioate decarboxylase